MATVMHILLSHGSGLFIGPDCDGVLNVCDPAALK